MDALDLLAEDHDNVQELFRQFHGGGGLTGVVRRAIGSVSSAEKLQAASDICNALEIHTQIEEAIFYPAVQAIGDRNLDRQVREALEEHHTVKQEMAALRDALAAAAAELEALVGQLEDDVEHHASEEEDAMFPRVEKLMPERTREDLAQQMLALKQRMRRRTRAGATPSHSAGA